MPSVKHVLLQWNEKNFLIFKQFSNGTRQEFNLFAASFSVIKIDTFRTDQIYILNW